MRQGRALARLKVRAPATPVSGVKLWAQRVVLGLRIVELPALLQRLTLSGLHVVAAGEVVTKSAEVGLAAVAVVVCQQVLFLRNHHKRPPRLDEARVAKEVQLRRRRVAMQVQLQRQNRKKRQRRSLVPVDSAVQRAVGQGRGNGCL